MKRGLTILIIVAVALVSCSRDDAAIEQPIGFNVAGMEQTRAVITSVGEIETLGVFGYSTGTDNFSPSNPAHTPNLLFNRLVEQIGGDWIYTPLAYWPLNAAIRNTFFAYSPHSSLFPSDANLILSNSAVSGYPTITYTVPTNVEEQIDILYSEMDANKNLDIDKTTNSGTVLYSMKHALSRIKFYVAPAKKSPLGDESYTVTSLSFTSTSPDFITRATLNLGTGVWTEVNTEPENYTFNIDQTNYIEEEKVVEITIAGGGNGSLMLIPQKITDALINISFTYSGDSDGEEYSFAVPFPNVQLNAGKLSVFIIRISIDGVWIIFDEDNQIEAWDDNNGNMYNVGEFDVY